MTEVQAPRITIKIGSLSDLIFGLALSIGSLELLSKAVSDLQDIALNVLYFTLSFSILVWTWLGYSRTMSVLRGQSSNTLLVNIILLLVVAIEPYLFYILVSSPTSDFEAMASIPYALDVAAIFFVQAGLVHLVLVEDGRSSLAGRDRLHPAIAYRFHRTMLAEIAVGSIFLFSSLPLQFLWTHTPLGYTRFIFWYSSFLVYIIIRTGKMEQETAVPKVRVDL